MEVDVNIVNMLNDNMYTTGKHCTLDDVLPFFVPAVASLHSILDLRSFLLVHLPRLFVDVLRFLSIRESDVPIPWGSISPRPMMPVT